MTRRAFGSMYAEDTEAALTAWARNPGPPPEAESFVDWGTLVSGLKGFPTAALERAGSFMDAVSAIEASGHRAVERERAAHPERFGEDQVQRIQRNKEAQQRLEQAGPALRRKAEEFAPNPETAHTADKVVHGLARGVSKAVADVMLFGPVGGAAVFGADEGNTTARRLIEQEGVDPATAAKVGLTTAVVQGASVALPVVGPTVGKTIGLALAGGPASYAAQEQITKQILQKADYSHLAAQHDPFDPLGLALSTAIPGVIGGLHIRSLKKQATVEDVVKHIESGGRRYGKDGELLTSPKGAQGEMQVMPGTAKDPGFGVTPARDNSPEELARVGRDYLAAMQQRYGDTDKALAAYNAGPGAVDAAVKKGGADWLKSMPDETKAYVAKANKLLGDVAVAKGAEDPAVVDAARVRVTDEAMAKSLPDTPTAHADVMRAADEIGAGQMPDVPPVRDIDLPQFREWFAESKVVDEQGAPLVVYHGTPMDFDAFSDKFFGLTDGGAMGKGYYFSSRPEVASRIADSAAAGGLGNASVLPVYISAKRPAAWTEELQALRQRTTAEAFTDHLRNDGFDSILKQHADGSVEWVVFDAPQIKSAIGNSGKFDPNSPSLTDPLKPGEVSPRDSVGNALPRPDSVALEPEMAKAAGAKTDEGSVDQARLKQLLDDQPDLRVKLPGSDETLSVEEALLRAHEDYDDEVSVAELLKVAAECALMNGA